MIKSNSGKPRGILNLKAGEKKFQLSRHLPAQDLSFFVERYWIVSWDLRGQEPYVQETLPYPCVNLVFEPGGSRIYGVITGKFTRRLEGAGQVFGIKFRPGAFYPFLKSPVSQITNEAIRLDAVFDIDGDALEQAIFTQASQAGQVELVEQFLRARLPQQDPTIEAINQMMDDIISDPAIAKVEDVAR